MPAVYPIEPEQARDPGVPEGWGLREGLGKFALNRIFRFATVGGFVCGVDLVLVWFFSHFIWATLAVSMAYLFAVAVHFCLNKWWVFENHDARYGRQIWKYGLTVLACWLCTLLVFSIAMRFLTSQILVAKLIAIPPTTLLGYLVMRRFVFAGELPARSAN